MRLLGCHTVAPGLVHVPVYIGTPLFWTPWDHEMTVLIIEVSSFQGLKMYYGKV